MAGGRLLTMGLLKSNTATLRKRPIRARPSGNLAEAASYRPSNAYSDPSACRRQGVQCYGVRRMCGLSSDMDLASPQQGESAFMLEPTSSLSDI
jgi:hypothetical protein